MNRFFLCLFFVFIFLGGNAWADEAKKDCITVQPGDNLTKIARTLDTTVSDLAGKNGIENPNRINPGQIICLEGGQKPTKASKEPETGVASNAPTGYAPYAETGVNPLVPEGKRNPQLLSQVEKDALHHIGASGQDIDAIEAAISGGKAEAISLLPGTKFVSMSERGGKGKSVKITRNRIATWKAPEKAVVVTLSDGRKIARIESCFNWAHVEVEPTRSASIAVAAVTPQLEPTPEPGVELCDLDDHDLFASVGRTDGNGSKTGWRYAAGFACIAQGRVDGGTVKAGVAGVYGDHSGRATADGFRYSGNKFAWGPAVKYLDDDGWDARLGVLLWGKFHSDGHSADGKYVQKRDFSMRGLDFGMNLYQREIDGEKWFPKLQLYGAYSVLSGKKLSHSWEGVSIPDTGNLESDSLLSVGARLFVYQAAVKPWISVEYFAERPSAGNLTGMIGVTDEDEILWAGVGFTRNLEKGGTARSWMVGVDVGNGIRVLRGKLRHDEWVAANTSHYDEETGAFSLAKSPSQRETAGQSNAPRPAARVPAAIAPIPVSAEKQNPSGFGASWNG